MSFKQYFKRAISLPPHVVFLKVTQLLTFRAKALFLQFKDKILPTYSQSFTNEKPLRLFPTAPAASDILKFFPELAHLLSKTMNHEFELLGSGWTQVHHGMKAKGLANHSYSHNPSFHPEPKKTDWIKKAINSSNQKHASNVWSLISQEYAPIDWHLDFKSGYRWKENVWWFRIPYGHKPGVDIKVPWEISRAQHLPWLSFGYATEQKSAYALEFQNQILDFIASNPPKYGVNWRCAMDVAIRAANWALSYDFFKSYGWKFDVSFNRIFLNSLYDHGSYVYNNLEIGKDGFRGNHYLADVCGLAFISSLLPETQETNLWFQFAHKALETEMDYQFFDDGANFEGSTAYHRLSSEMMLYTTLLFLHQKNRLRKFNLPVQFSDKYMRKLFSMSKFTKTVTRPDGKISQVGDCDSGRFFKLQPLFEPHQGLIETHLDFSCLTEAIDSFFKTPTMSKYLEGSWISSLQTEASVHDVKDNDKTLANFGNSALLPLDITNLVAQIKNGMEISFANLAYPVQTTVLKVRENILSTSLFLYEDFGLLGWKSDSFYLGFRCGPVGQKNRGGHDHNDQLSLEVYADGNPIIEDPGTAIYTPLPHVRNSYRSVKSHFAPLVTDTKGKIVEPAPLDQGLFSLAGNQRSYILIANDTTLAGFNPRLKTVRFVFKKSNAVEIYDICLEKSWKFSSERTVVPYSKGYGWF
ncbi:heparinase II/III family protein [Bdellovibrio sp. HCB117]|uniref:heparinase II/III family protein n=1 Tax=Bdellovibrio sp. HCB117 TaxID=3394359 RepID=UPI0039B60FAB